MHNNIKDSREKLGLNKTQMAKAMGVNRQNWIKWESLENRIPFGPVRQIETLVWLKDNGLLEGYLKHFCGKETWR